MEGRIMKNAKFVAVALLLVLLVGCASSVTKSEVDREYMARYNYGQRVGLWFVDRFNDIFDTFQVDLMFGATPTWPLINARVTKFLQLGMGWFDGTRIGLRPRAFGVWQEQRQEYGFGPIYWISIKREPISGLPAMFDHSYEYTGWDIMEKPNWKEGNGGVLDVGATVFIVVIGAHANIATFETLECIIQFIPVDLILFICNYPQPVLDFMKDDTYNQLKMQIEAEKGLDKK
jgi:hypothetical protein